MVKKLLLITVLCLSVFSLAACGLTEKQTGTDQKKHTSENQSNSTGGQTTANQPAAGPTNPSGNASTGIHYINSETAKNEELVNAIMGVLDGIDEANARKSRYYYNYVDLNDDHNQEVIVQVAGPDTSGADGDEAFIFLQRGNKFALLDRLGVIHHPIIISNEKTNGWHDIIVMSDKEEARYVCLKFDGQNYSSPSSSAEVVMDSAIAGTGIISDNFEQDVKSGKGLYLK